MKSLMFLFSKDFDKIIAILGAIFSFLLTIFLYFTVYKIMYVFSSD